MTCGCSTSVVEMASRLTTTPLISWPWAFLLVKTEVSTAQRLFCPRRDIHAGMPEWMPHHVMGRRACRVFMGRAGFWFLWSFRWKYGNIVLNDIMMMLCCTVLYCTYGVNRHTVFSVLWVPPDSWLSHSLLHHINHVMCTLTGTISSHRSSFSRLEYSTEISFDRVLLRLY